MKELVRGSEHAEIFINFELKMTQTIRSEGFAMKKNGVLH